MRHKWWANTKLLASIGEHQAACEDRELRLLLLHILVSNRYWLLLALGEPFHDEVEKRLPESHAAITARFRETEIREQEWLRALTDEELDRHLVPRALGGASVTVAQALIQISLHSQGHRAQCATRLRAIGGTPAPMDFVLWVRDRQAT